MYIIWIFYESNNYCGYFCVCCKYATNEVGGHFHCTQILLQICNKALNLVQIWRIPTNSYFYLYFFSNLIYFRELILEMIHHKAYIYENNKYIYFIRIIGNISALIRYKFLIYIFEVLVWIIERDDIFLSRWLFDKGFICFNHNHRL